MRFTEKLVSRQHSLVTSDITHSTHPPRCLNTAEGGTLVFLHFGKKRERTDDDERDDLLSPLLWQQSSAANDRFNTKCRGSSMHHLLHQRIQHEPQRVAGWFSLWFDVHPIMRAFVSPGVSSQRLIECFHQKRHLTWHRRVSSREH